MLRFPRANRAGLAAIAIAALCLASGCAHLPAYQQERLSRPDMTFSNKLTEQDAPALAAQLEPGSQVSAGAQNAGCSACR